MTTPMPDRQTKPFVIDGELTIYRALELHGALQAALADTAELDVDLAAVTEFDSAGVQLLVAAHKSAAAAGGRLTVVNPSPAVHEVLGLLDLAAFFAVPAAAGAAAH